MSCLAQQVQLRFTLRLTPFLLCVCVCVQVHPPDSPPCPSPLQGSLHSQGSEGSGQQDDFVMVDFVCSYFFLLGEKKTVHSWVQTKKKSNLKQNKIPGVLLWSWSGFSSRLPSVRPSLKTTCCRWIWAPSTESFRILHNWPVSHFTSVPNRWPTTW